MENFPYWAYAAVPGTLSADKEEAALAEGRRLAALTLAVQYQESGSFVVEAATEFEAYLRGDEPFAVVERSEYDSLVDRSNELLRLERNGVDNWEGYSRG